uniref:Uncharacterized protein n=1 Tax=Buteo japonicus TaxID=224669 RepID=A0A8C0BYJ4_9AVES
LATTALPADDQSLPANASCTILRLVSCVRRMVGVPDTAFPNIIHLCDELGTPKLLFQVTSLSERTSKFLQVCGTYYMCRVEFGAPGRWIEEENTCWSFTLLLEHPSAALTGGRGDGEQPGGQAQAWGPGAGAGGCQTSAPEMLEERRMPDMETLPSTARGQGAVRGCQWPP